MPPAPSNRSSPQKKAGLEINRLRKKLARRLPDFLDSALERYNRLVEPENIISPDDKWGAQAKAALTHITLLIKLADWVYQSDCDHSPIMSGEESPEEMVQSARKALASFEGRKKS